MIHLPGRLAEVFQGVALILHAGDLVTSLVLADLKRIAPVVAVAGNMDPPDVRRQLPRQTTVTVEGHTIGLIHGDYLSRLAEVRSTGIDYDDLYAFLRRQFPGARCIVYGHTHRARAEERDGVLFFNPGAVATYRVGDVSTVGVLMVDAAGITGQIVGLDESKSAGG